MHIIDLFKQVQDDNRITQVNTGKQFDLILDPETLKEIAKEKGMCKSNL